LFIRSKEEARRNSSQPAIRLPLIYTGTLLDGTKFDSNETTAFHHVRLTHLFWVPDSDQRLHVGFALLKVVQSYLYIPSGMLWSTERRPGGGANPKGIPANSILVFDVLC